MYESFYGLKEKPFDLGPDPRYLYMSEAHEYAYTHLEYAITEDKGFVIITGATGSGKTTLINYLLSRIRQRIRVGVINYTPVFPADFMKMVCQEFDLKIGGKDKASMVDVFHRFLQTQFAQGWRVILVVDEAQNLPSKTIEEIRMLSNFEAQRHHLIQIVLVGQPGLHAKLQMKDLEQFAQRVTVHGHLEALKAEEVGQYINHRLRVAGANRADIFTGEFIEAVHRYSRGIPRVINILCDTALVYGYADEKRRIDGHVLEEVVKAREVGGAVSGAREGEGAASPSPAEAQLNKKWANYLRSLEKRMSRLERTVTTMNQTLHALTNGKERRDEIILELLKMLKENMESRNVTHAKYEQIIGQLEARGE
jgi:general secretion pathway protein A